MSEEEEYFQTIENYFLQKRGNPILLSPKEWSLIRDWYENSIPQDVVLRAVDRAFEKNPDGVTSLVYCRRLVKSEYKKFLKTSEGKSPSIQEGIDAQNVGEFLKRLIDALQHSSELAAGSGNRALSDFLQEKKVLLNEQIYKGFVDNGQNNLQRVEQQLTKLEQEIEQILLQMISEDQLQRLKEESMRELKSFENKLELPVYQEMLRRSLIKSVRKHYEIPRLSLFFM